MLKIINDNWKWLNINFIEIIDENEFGNFILLNNDKTIWRICPEELLCEKITENLEDYLILKTSIEFIEDWNLEFLKDLAFNKLGFLSKNEKYTLLKPGVLGGEYNADNLIKLSGDLAFQIKDLKDGQKIVFKIN